MDTMNQDRPTMWTTGYLPNGCKISFTCPVTNWNSAFDDAMQFTNKLLEKGFTQHEPGLEAGEHKEQVGFVSRRQKKNDDTTITPIIDVYSPNEAMKFKFISVYLNTPEDVTAFENASGLKLTSLPLVPGKAALDKSDDSGGIVKVNQVMYIVTKSNPYFDPNEKDIQKMKPKNLFVRWEGTQPAVSPQPMASTAASEPPKPEPARNAELRNEQLTITSIEPRPDSTGWYAYGMFHDGIGSHKVTVNLFLPEDRDKITAQGYEWVTSGAVNWPVTLRIQDNRARIDKVLPKGDSGQSGGNSPSSAKLGQPANDPTWFGTHVNECWGMVKQYLLTNLYNKNPYHMKGSMWKHSVSADKEASLPSGDWANRTAGDFIHALEARHENEQPLQAAS